MNEDTMSAVLQQTPEAPSLTSREEAATGIRDAIRHRVLNRNVSDRLTSTAVRVLDQGSLTAALTLTVISAFLRQNDNSLSSLLGRKISFRAVLLEICLLGGWRVMFWAMSLYQPRLISGIGSLLWRVPLTIVPCAALLIPVFVWRMPGLQLAHSCMVFWFVGTTLMLSVRATFFSYEELVRPRFRKPRSVVICGTGMRARGLAVELSEHPEFRYQVLGFVDSMQHAACAGIAPLLGPVAALESLLMRLPVDEVIVALPVKSHFSDVEHIVNICGRAGVQLQYSLDLFTTEIAKNRTLERAADSRVVLEMVNRDHRMFLKDFLDRGAALIGLLLLAPVMLCVAAAIKFSSRGPIFFVQHRYGLNKRQFGMIKFRSMVTDAEARLKAIEHLNETGGPMFKLKNDPRITGIGRLIRRTSLDELPQLINVLRGEMSLVGPRPLPQRDVEHFSEAWLMRRFSVKPGITGLWQVSGRSSTDFDSAIKLDLRYIDRWSLAMDARILLRTLTAVVRGSGAY